MMLREECGQSSYFTSEVNEKELASFAGPKRGSSRICFGAGDGIRTRNPQLGKLMRYRCATPAQDKER